MIFKFSAAQIIYQKIFSSCHKIWINKNDNIVVHNIFWECQSGKGTIALNKFYVWRFKKRRRKKIPEWLIFFLFKWDQVAITDKTYFILINVPKKIESKFMNYVFVKFSCLDNYFFNIQKAKCMKRTKEWVNIYHITYV